MSALSASNLLLLFVAMWFIGVEVQQETSAPPPKKSWIRPWYHYKLPNECKTFRNVTF